MITVLLLKEIPTTNSLAQRICYLCSNGPASNDKTAAATLLTASHQYKTFEAGDFHTGNESLGDLV